MGCVSVRLSPEEAIITRFSVITGFEKHSPEALFSAIKERSSARLILSTQFEAIKTRLKLNTAEADKAILNKFYDRMWRQDKMYKEKLRQVSDRLADSVGEKFAVMEEEQLLTLAILLSNGNYRSKATALFNVFDEGCIGTISANAVRSMLQIVFSHAIEVCPLLLKEEGNREEVKKYFGKAMEHRQRSVSVVASIMVKKTELTCEEFLAEFAEYQEGQLTSPAGLRRFAHNLIQAFPAVLNPPRPKVPRPIQTSDEPILRDSS